MKKPFTISGTTLILGKVTVAMFCHKDHQQTLALSPQMMDALLTIKKRALEWQHYDDLKALQNQIQAIGNIARLAIQPPKE